MSPTNRRWVNLLPVLMFLLFAGFWTTVDVLHELWLAVLPSGLILLALLASAASAKGEAER